MSLGGLKAKPGLKAAATKPASKPKKALLGDDEPEDTNAAQEIAGFDAAEGGAISTNGPKEKKGPLVIPSLPNRNWREEARKKQLERAPHTQHQQNGDVVMDEPEKEVVYGLTVPTQRSTDAEEANSGAPDAMDVDTQAGNPNPDDNLTDAQRLEQRALESLLTGRATDTARIVPAITDEQALANDLASAPDEPSIAAYEATPIEGFGLAMLRGMGWKDSDGDTRRNGAGGKPPAEVKRRPALLGIGAKEDAAKDVELGEFNSKARRPGKGQKGPRGAEPQGYNPVTLRNKKTGEVISEEELKRKLEGQEMVNDESERSERGDRSERSERKRDRDRDDSTYDSERRRDRSDRDTDRRHARDNTDRRDRDRDRHRRDDRRDRDRDRDRDRRDRRDRDRSRSPRADYKRRDRYRSRSRSRDGGKSRRERSRDGKDGKDKRDGKDRRERRERSTSRDRERDGDAEERRRRRREREREREERSSRR